MQHWRSSSSRTTERGRKSVSCCNSLAMRLTQVQLNLAVQGSPTMAGTNSTTVQWRLHTKDQKQPRCLLTCLCPLPCHPPSAPAKQLQSQAVTESGESPEESEPCWLEPWYQRMLQEGEGQGEGSDQKHLSWHCSQMLCILKPQLWIHCLAQKDHTLHLLC